MSQGRSSAAGPFAWVHEGAQPSLLAALTVLFVVSSAWLAYAGGILFTPEAPLGIVSYELAGDLDTTRAILRSWSDEARAWALLIQGVDYLYLFVYPAWFSLCVTRLARRLPEAWRRVGFPIAWAVLAAAPLDAVENYALVMPLLAEPTAFHASLAWWCAVPKFALVTGAEIFLLTGLLAWAIGRRDA